MNNEKLLTDGPAEGTATSFTRYQIKYVSPEYTEAIAKKGIALTNPNPTVEVNEFFVENVEKRVDTKRHCWGESVDEYELCEAVIAEYQAVKDSLSSARKMRPALIAMNILRFIRMAEFILSAKILTIRRSLPQ